MRRRLHTVLILILLTMFCHAEQNLLAIRLWCELEPMVQEIGEYPLSTEAAQKRVLEEAREILSGMIYGFRFSYTPGDKTRQINEEFTATPIAQILWGDLNMRITDAYVQDTFLFVKVCYDLEDFQFSRRRAWASNSVDSSSGVGEYSVFIAPSPQGKRQALQEALKNAVRNALRPVYFNKPREVTGEILIWSEPHTVIQSGTYTTRLDVKLRVKEIRSYSLF